MNPTPDDFIFLIDDDIANITWILIEHGGALVGFVLAVAGFWLTSRSCSVIGERPPFSRHKFLTYYAIPYIFAAVFDSIFVFLKNTRSLFPLFLIMAMAAASYVSHTCGIVSYKKIK